MKKNLPFLLCILLCAYNLFSFLVPPRSVLLAAAEENENTDTYACILSRDVYLYASENENSGLFLLPYTYYVKVLAEGIDFCYVQYSTDSPPFQAVYGYCKYDALRFVDFVPVRPFLYYTIDVTYRLEDYSDFFSGEEVFSSVTLTYAYYGDYIVGSSTYCYVGLDGKTGYLPKTMDVSYDLNTDYQTQETQEPTEEPSSDEALPAAQIVLLAVMALLAAGMVYYLFRPRPALENQREETGL